MAMLERMAADEEHDPHAGILLEYANPVSGGHLLPTMCARIQMLRPGESTRPQRHTGFIRFNVVQGEGVTTVDQDEPTEMNWTHRDIFRIPHWRWYSMRNTSATEPAILFSISFNPLAEMLGFYREEKA
jgi:gentisate 1,2-dioxygenase